MAITCKDKNINAFMSRVRNAVNDIHQDVLSKLRSEPDMSRNDVLELIKQVAHGDEEIEKACLFTAYLFIEHLGEIKTIEKRRKRHKRREVLQKFYEIESRNHSNTKQANIALTAKELGMTPRAVKKHVYAE